MEDGTGHSGFLLELHVGIQGESTIGNGNIPIEKSYAKLMYGSTEQSKEVNTMSFHLLTSDKNR